MNKSSKVNVTKVNVVAELENAGWLYEPTGNYQIKTRCPFHDDTNPSASVNTETNVWKCHGCGESGDIIKLLAKIADCDRNTMIVMLGNRYDIHTRRTIKLSTIEAYHQKIWAAKTFLQALYDRGVTDELIRKARLGFHEGRITIPVFNANQEVINVRKYMPGAPGADKMRNIRGYTSVAIYMPDQLKYDNVWLCGGEMKALAATLILNPHDIGAVAITGGEGSWSQTFASEFKDKAVFICMDVDKTGIAAARKLAHYLYFVTKKVFIAKLPLNTKEFPKGDINDWIVNGAEWADFEEIMHNCEAFVPEYVADDEDEPEIELRLSDTTSPQHIGKRISCEAMIVAMDTTPYLVPKEVQVSCTRDQTNCHVCTMNGEEVNEDGYVLRTIKASSSGILEVVDSIKSKQKDAIRSCLNIPPCNAVNFKVNNYYDVYDARLAPQLAMTGDNSDYIVQQAMIVGVQNVDLNSPYLFVGKAHPHPKTQQATLVMDEAKQSKDNLSSFMPTDDELQKLEKFIPHEWSEQGIQEKLDEIYEDFEANVTRIYKRRDLHLAIDLTFHSCLHIDFDGRIHNGWVNSLVVGDSAQGKTETTARLIEHYGLGVKHDCKNASAVGLLGGLQQLNGRWFISWGVIPLHDRRLVVLEELKGAPQDVISKLTDMRSTGIAEISKIEKRRAHARTRLIALSNPRSNKQMSGFNFGIQAIYELIGGLEDVRRFDFAIIVSADEIDPSVINKLGIDRPKVLHKFKKSESQTLVLWAWTRTKEQIIIDDDALHECLRLAIEMCDKFTDMIPLVDRGTMKHKLIRLAVALAARTFSTSKMDRHTLIVRKCHVQYVKRFLDNHYSKKAFGYADLSKSVKFQRQLLDPQMVKKHILIVKYPADFVQHMLHTDEMTRDDICDWCEIERDGAQKLISLFVRKHAIKRVKTWYEKTSEFIVLLKEMHNVPEEGLIMKGEKF